MREVAEYGSFFDEYEERDCRLVFGDNLDNNRLERFN